MGNAQYPRKESTRKKVNSVGPTGIFKLRSGQLKRCVDTGRERLRTQHKHMYQNTMLRISKYSISDPVYIITQRKVFEPVLKILKGRDLPFKGTVSRDFLLLVFFINQFPPSPRVSHLDRFEFFRKFAEIFAAQG
jgi:hypothetical protein